MRSNRCRGETRSYAVDGFPNPGARGCPRALGGNAAAASCSTRRKSRVGSRQCGATETAPCRFCKETRQVRVRVTKDPAALSTERRDQRRWVTLRPGNRPYWRRRLRQRFLRSQLGRHLWLPDLLRQLRRDRLNDLLRRHGYDVAALSETRARAGPTPRLPRPSVARSSARSSSNGPGAQASLTRLVPRANSSLERRPADAVADRLRGAGDDTNPPGARQQSLATWFATATAFGKSR